MSEPLVFEVPLPPRALSPNQRAHWRKKAQATEIYRSQCGWTIRATECDRRALPYGRARVSLVFGLKGGKEVGVYQPRDTDNALASFKAGIDSLRDAGVLLQDSRSHMELGTVEITSKAGPFVRITVEEVQS